MERAGKTIVKLKSVPGISAEQLACAAWPEAVGKTVAAHTTATTLVRSRLIVAVEDSTWQRQLFSMRNQIVTCLQKVLGDDLVLEVEFRIGVRKRPPQVAVSASATGAEAIVDPVFRLIYQQSKKRAIS